MQSRLPSTAALASLLVLAAAGGAIAQPNYRTGQWIAGRATYVFSGLRVSEQPLWVVVVNRAAADRVARSGRVGRAGGCG
jgi:hypothetical protein